MYVDCADEVDPLALQGYDYFLDLVDLSGVFFGVGVCPPLHGGNASAEYI